MTGFGKKFEFGRLTVAVVALSICMTMLPDLAVAALPGKMKVGDAELVLNGYGARKRSILQLYIAGLYLVEKNADSNAIIDAEKPMALRLEVTSQFVSQSNLLAALNEGFQNSTGGDVGRIRTQIEQFRGLFSDSINTL